MLTEPRPSAAGHPLLARAGAAHGLAGSMLDFLPEPLDDEAFAELLAYVQMQRLSGLLWSAIVDGRLPVTSDQADKAEWLHVGALSAALVLERLLVDTVDEFGAAGLPVRVLKGTAVGHLDYPDPGLRTFGDIDLMVPGERFDKATELLQRRGHRRNYPEPRPGFDRRFNKGASFLTQDGLEIDLHRTFTMGPFGVRLDLWRLWESYSEFTVAGHVLKALGPEERFLHACYHAVLGNTRPNMVPLRDVAQIALTRRLDLVRLHELIRASRGEAVVARAIEMAWSELDIADITALSAWASSYRLDSQDKHDLSAYAEGTNYARRSLASVRSLRGVRQQSAYLFALLVPQNGYLGFRHRGRFDRLRTGWRSIAWRPLR